MALVKIRNARRSSRITSYVVEEFSTWEKSGKAVRRPYSNWRYTTSEFSQGAVLTPVMLILYVNDMPDNINRSSYIVLFADGAQVMREIQDHDSYSSALQQDIATLYEWSKN